MDALCLPPFWETRRDSNLTIRLISAQQSERRAECRLIRRRLHRVMIEQELYGRLDKRTTQRVHKADVSLGIARGVLRSSGLTPAGKSFDDIDSDTLSALHGSGTESDASWDLLVSSPVIATRIMLIYIYIYIARYWIYAHTTYAVLIGILLCWITLFLTYNYVALIIQRSTFNSEESMWANLVDDCNRF